MNDAPVIDLDWTTVISMDEFSSIVARLERHRMVRLREALIAKAQAIIAQLTESWGTKTNRDGAPLERPEYNAWKLSAENALACTEKQIQSVSACLFGMTMPPLLVLAKLIDVADGVDDLDPDEVAAIRIAKHFLKGAKP